ncbi:MAG: Gfo/Idh/MocA family oxidoreductase [Thermoleophilia bacterium]|nr:Gfo/Idh/MocA family oxidoreductase [Thermoleophilia bacterium]
MGVRWGLLSTAAINEEILDAARATEHAEIVAVASRDAGTAAAYAERHGIPRSHGSYDDLLADAGVEAVYIPLPNSMHVEWTRRALEAGKHVLVEKPFGRDPAEVAEVCALAEERGLVLSEAFMWRHHPQAARLEELLREGAIGRPLLVRAVFGFPLEELRGATDTRFDAALDGGGLMDVGCYCISAIRLVAGEEPDRVHAERLEGPTGVDLVLGATMRMPGGLIGQFDCGFLSRHRDELEIVGEGGSLFLDDPWHCREPVIEVRRDGGVERIEVDRADPYRCELDDLAAAIEGRRPLRHGTADAIAQSRVLEAVHRAAVTGLAVRPGSSAGS